MAEPTKHNGRFAKVAAVAALKLRLVQLPLRPQAFAPFGFSKPPLCLAPLALRVWPVARQAVATSHTPDIHWPVRYRPGPKPQSVLVRRVPRSITSGRPAHPGPSVAPGFSRFASSRPVLTDRPSPSQIAGQPKTNSHARRLRAAHQYQQLRKKVQALYL